MFFYFWSPRYLLYKPVMIQHGHLQLWVIKWKALAYFNMVKYQMKSLSSCLSLKVYNLTLNSQHNWGNKKSIKFLVTLKGAVNKVCSSFLYVETPNSRLNLDVRILIFKWLSKNYSYGTGEMVHLGTVIASQAWGPELRSPTVIEKLGWWHAYVSLGLRKWTMRMGGSGGLLAKQPSWKGKLHYLWENLSWKTSGKGAGKISRKLNTLFCHAPELTWCKEVSNKLSPDLQTHLHMHTHTHLHIGACTHTHNY